MATTLLGQAQERSQRPLRYLYGLVVDFDRGIVQRMYIVATDDPGPPAKKSRAKAKAKKPRARRKKIGV